MIRKYLNNLIYGYKFYMSEGEGAGMASEGSSEVASEAPSEPSESTSSESNSEIPQEAENVSESNSEAPAEEGEFSWDNFWDKKLKTKVNGEESEVSLAKMFADYQKGLAGDKKFQEASELRKKAEADAQNAMKMLSGFTGETSDIVKNLTALGKDPVAIAEAIIEDHIAKMEEDPKDRQIREYEQQVAQFKQQEDARQKAVEEYQKQQEEIKRQESISASKERLDLEISDAIKKLGTDPDMDSIQGVASIMLDAMEAGTEVSADIAARMYQEDLNSKLQAKFKALPKDKILDFLGEDVAKAIRDADLNRLRDEEKNIDKNSVRPSVPDEAPKTLREYNRWLRKKEGYLY